MSWVIQEHELGERSPEFFSTIFAVGNGHSTTRGTLPEEGLGSFRGVYVSGLYTRAGYGLVYLMGAPDWLPAHLEVEGTRLECHSSHRTLDMKHGLLRREARFENNTDSVDIHEERFAALDRPHLLCQKLRVMPVKIRHPVDVVIGLDADVRNHPAKYFKPGTHPNCDEAGLRLSRPETVKAQSGSLGVTIVSDATHTRASLLAAVRQVSGPRLRAVPFVADGRACIRFRIPPSRSGATFEFEKVCVLTADIPDHQDAVEDGRALFRKSKRLSYDSVVETHMEAVRAFWNEADVEIDGDPHAQTAVRFALWSTRIAAPLNGGASSIGAKNLTGDWYRGAVFWDMEMFQFPMLAAVQPDLARNHLLYRARRLPAARTLAAQDGYTGARFPWHSYHSGLEEPPLMGGGLYQEQHVNVAVPWAILHYLSLSDDNAFLLDYGLEVLIETCRFWISRMDGPDDDGIWHIRRVTGPDEEHPGVDDNAYTNRMVVWLVEETASLVNDLESSDPERLREILSSLNLDRSTLDVWLGRIARLHVPMIASKQVMAQYAGFEQVEESNEQARRDRGARFCKTHKQADTLLLFQTTPDRFTNRDLERHWVEYAPLCRQTSSLSLCTHALLACRLGLTRDAERFYHATLGVDLQDQLGNTAHGIHGAGEGGIWLATVHGFGGLRVNRNGISVSPQLPKGWRSLKYRFIHRRQPLAVTVTPREIVVESAGRKPVHLTVAGYPCTIPPAGRIRRPYKVGWRTQTIGAVIFDLDGVLVSTDRFHYLAWKELADHLGLPFDEEINHRLRGVSREDSLKIIFGNRALPPETEFRTLCDRKNARYVEYIRQMTPADVLPGAVALLTGLRSASIRIAIASASRNAALVLARTGLDSFTDALSDGNIITVSKPDPQGFLLAAERLRVLPWHCIGVEDAEVGIEAIHRAGMVAVGIGSQATRADHHAAAIADVSVEVLRQVFKTHHNRTDPYRERNLAKMAEELRETVALAPPRTPRRA